MRIVVYHSGYGCDTGCCGHVVETDDGRHEFYFDHPWTEDFRAFAEGLVRAKFGEEHVEDLDWENSKIFDD